MQKTVAELKKEKFKIEKNISQLKSDLYPLHQEETIASLKTPVILLGGDSDDFNLFISVQDGNKKIHSFEDSRDNDEMKPNFRSLLYAANPMNREGWREKGTVLFS